MRLLALLLVPLLVAGCEALPRDASESGTNAEYRTGSNIPQRDRSTQIEYKSIDQNSIPRNTMPASRSAGG